MMSPSISRRAAILSSVGFLAALTAAGLSGCAPSGTASKTVRLLNVSYDPTRELWRELNDAFIAKYKTETGTDLEIDASHAASGSQARQIIDGLEADVATLSLWSDTDALRKQGLLKEGWEDALPNRSLPYTSTVVFVVRKGNPKGIKDWNDLAQPGVQIITPNPKTSGNGRLSLLAAWGSVVLRGGSEADARDLLRKIYLQVPVLDTGARGSTSTFLQKEIGDIHLAMESEAYLEVRESKGSVEIIYPSISILHEPHVAVVDKVVDQKGTREVSTEYLKFLYTPQGQDIIAKHYFRPTDPEALKKYAGQFPEVELFPLAKVADGWDAAQATFFAEGGIFDQVSKPAAR